MFRLIPLVLGSLAVVACGLVHGFWTDRWAPAAEPTNAAARLADIPLSIGDWEGSVIDAKPSPAAGKIAGMTQRRYVNRVTGDTVLIALVCGRSALVAIHTPDVCYGASGYNFGPRSPAKVNGTDAEFWTADGVLTQTTEEKQMRFFWGWNDGKGWKAPQDARQQFPRVPVLHKLYVIRELNGPAARDGGGEPCLSFLQVLIPALNQSLFAAGS